MNHHKSLPKLFGVFLALIIVFTAVSTVQATEIYPNGTIPVGITVDDDVILNGNAVVMDGVVNGLLLASGNTVTINGTVNGDVIALGSQVTIGAKAVITGNLFAGAQSVTLDGQVDGSVAAGAASLTLSGSARVARNVYFGGYAYSAATGSVVNRDLWTGGFQSILNGEIGRNARVFAAAVEVGGIIGGDATFDVDVPGEGPNPSQFMPFSQMPGVPASIEPGLRISSEAQIGGKLTYTSPMEQSGAIASQPEGGVIYQTPIPSEADQKAAEKPLARLNTPLWNKVWTALRNLITLTFVGLLTLWFAPTWLRRAVDALKGKPWQSMGVGFLGIVAFPPVALLIAGLILMLVIAFAVLTLGGISGILGGLGFSTLAFIASAFGLLVLYGSKVIVVYLVGEMLLNKIAPAAETNWRRFWALLVGVVLYIILSLIPFLGWLVVLGVTFLGMGALWYMFKPSVASLQSADTVTTV